MAWLSRIMWGCLALVSALLTGCFSFESHPPPSSSSPKAAPSSPATYTTHIQALLCNDTLKTGQSVRRTLTTTLPSIPPKADVIFGSDLTSSMVEEVAKAKTNSTAMMNEITNLIPDTSFGAFSFKDYAKSFLYCGYQGTGGTPVLYGSGTDYPYRLDQAMTVNKTLVSNAINTWNVSTDPNTDYPASYTRALWELYNDNAINWRSGSKRFVILFGDALPHDCSFVVSPYTVNTGADPGRDAVAGNADDLKWVDTINGLKNNNITLITLYSGPAKLSLGGGPPLQIYNFWSLHSTTTGGRAEQLDQQGNLPNNTNIAQFIKQTIQSISAIIKSLTIELCKDQPATYQTWLSSGDTRTNIASGTGPHSLSITVTPPAGTPPGNYNFALCIYGDGVEYARDTCQITVTDCQLPGVGDPCTVGVGACQASGTRRCNAAGTALVCSATAGSPTTEVCDGIDNNCNGQTDETWPTKGTACTVGVGECQRNGTFVCNAAQTNVQCSATAGTPIAELCDGKDNNCDGQIDEAFPTKGQPCTSGLGTCLRSGTFVCNAAQTAVQCSATAGTPTTELCDGLDNNCNGSIDETFPTKGQPCTSGVGECQRSGTFVCNAAQTNVQCSATAGTPAAELCDGLDNNCDGRIDETFPTKGQACQVGIGECQRSGTFRCNAAQTALECSVTAGSPTTELCDGKDNNCNGQIDETFPTKGQSCTVGIGACQRSGTFVCNAAQTAVQCSVTAGTPTAELCDGLDNNCNGQIDETWPTKGQSCTVGIGACQRSGTFRCNAAQTALECSVTAGTPVAELCDGIDNNCNGQIDETFPNKGQTCSAGSGGCQNSGIFLCNAAKTATECSASAGSGSSERCDGLDNDCNGQIDEAFPNKGQPCTVGVGECQKSGIFACSADGTATVCNQTPGLPSAEVCDGKDNDCNGQIDEAFPTKGQSCTVGVGECQKSGTFVCNAARTGVECSATAGTPTAEVCDGKDNNCNGQIDETFTNKGQTCTSGVGACQASGTFVCKPDGTGTQCSATTGSATAEKCDGIDNNCDGKIDEIFTDKGKACTVGLGECQKSGIFRCKADASALECDAQASQSSAEICDNKDNDCDGSIDNNVTRSCSSACGSGTEICTAGVWGACSAPKPQPEACDNKDNDCDGQVDNGLIRPCQTACGKGTETCAAGVWGTCSAPAPQAEICDGLDNDCDGKVDEDIPSRPCTGACGQGTARCEAGTFVGCDGLQPTAEVCDGQDNDCNGKIDDLEPRACKSECGEGKETCLEGAWKNCTAPKPAEEICDGVDNNCDGFVDNQAPCTPGQGCYKGQCLPTCQKNEDCGDKIQCVEGFCLGDPCKNVQCPDDKRCVLGRCVDACATITCPDGQICHQGKCRENSCYGLGCPGGTVCVKGQCEPDACLVAKCKADEACRQGICIPSCASVTCEAGKVCKDGLCVENPCATITCPQGKLCIGGSCQDDPCPALACPEGRICDPAEKRCIDDPCLTLQCPQGQICKNGQCAFEKPQEPAKSEEPSPETSSESKLVDGGFEGTSLPEGQSPGGCGCSSLSNDPSWLFLGLLGFAIFFRRRRLEPRLESEV